ncbi:N-acetylmuramoyl-L-alanine amidase [Thalassorhabdus alkalitolerans]|uniref:N-acetylmuramoyl-L-alanine amidase n=1 Tax=Thalassorhabdus alkalitolerans TaxID=2282697 RepID=A0ABW0YH82_9BACI
MRKPLPMLGIIFIVLLSLLAGNTHFAQANGEIKRLAGDNRIDTAIEISKEGWPNGLSGERAVILARADVPADALASSSLSREKDAPILLTYPNRVDTQTINELQRLNARTVYVLGGEDAISSTVVSGIRQHGYTVERIEGSNRSETALEINKKAGLGSSQSALLVNGVTIADALSASSIAANNNIPIYLANADRLRTELPSSVRNVTILGGPQAISTSLENSLTQQGIQVNRIAGDNRFETNLKALEHYSFSNDTIVVRGTSVSNDREDYPDAVAAASLSHKRNAPVVLSHHSSARSEVQNYLNSRTGTLFALGGPHALPDSVLGSGGSSTPAPSPSPEPEPESEDAIAEATVTASSLNVRSTPSGTIIGSLPNGSQVSIYSYEGSWAEIRYNGQKAYVSSNFLNVQTTSPGDSGSEPSDGIVASAKVAASTLNVRRTPNGSSLGSLRNGSSVDIYSFDGDWAEIRYEGQKAFVHSFYLNIDGKNNLLRGHVIAVDPGHGGSDPGAVANGLQEKELVLDVGLRLEKLLKDAGATVVMTRNTDTFVSLSNRSKIANDRNAHSFISIHANAAGSAAHGTETYWNHRHEPAQSKELAEKVQSRMIYLLQTNDRGAKEDRSLSFINTGFAVLLNSEMPAVLAELGFVTNSAEANRMKTNQFREDAANALYQGILDFHRQPRN